MRERPVLTEAESSLALLPEARAVRKSVLRKRFTGEANSISKSGEEKVSRIRSMDHCGIFCLSGGLRRNWLRASSEKVSVERLMLKA